MDENNKKKNIKISLKHHVMLKEYCDKNGLKVYRTIEKLIDDLCKPKRRDLYGD